MMPGSFERFGLTDAASKRGRSGCDVAVVAWPATNTGSVTSVNSVSVMRIPILSARSGWEELARLVKLFDEAKAEYAKDAKKAEAMATDPIGPLPKDANASELAAWTAVANVLLNLDEMLMRR